MDYKALNENQRKRMLQISKNDFSMEWENPDFLDALIGKLPRKGGEKRKDLENALYFGIMALHVNYP